MVFDGSVDAKTGVSLKGNMYWLASSETEFLLSFDFTGERFKRFYLPSLPPIFNLEDFKVRNRSLLVCMSSLFHEEKKLAVCCNLNRDMVTVIGQHDTHRGGSTVCDGGAR
ncbi:F-box associated ubiquitination effector family protein [Arabidopsis thaliana]|uniref:F-box associated ubiquitination effector family protein n=1 Tax=Arabidopsis thaliana TaxID=3702 RepID=F4J454_ARATH|nr:F-box associated ubiquitination effector family protein [Arabidopsis thaliana]AEE76790.1 F-box associated ubiquitination effector family protein [Arabidopsis thaliana]|eukprot:NP_001154641.1 F-box associated ubiquitination effector family protein [Arabidopsis thaliana]